MANNIEIQTANLTAQRVHTIDDKLSVLRAEYDSITNINSHLQEEINKNPFIIQTSVTNSTNSLVMSDGTIKKVNDPSVTRNQVANPKISQIEANNRKLEAISVQEQKWTEKKQTMEEDVRKECKESVGFLEELEAMWSIIINRPLAGAFYLVFPQIRK